MSPWVKPTIASTDLLAQVGAVRERSSLSVYADDWSFVGYRFGVFATFTNSSWPSARPSKSVSVALGSRRIPRAWRSAGGHAGTVFRTRTWSTDPARRAQPLA